jgi:hypothetical protein
MKFSMENMISRSAQIHLSTRWLGEPQSPLVHQRVFDVEVVFIVENSDLLISAWACLLALVFAICAFWRNGDCGQIDLIVSVDRCLGWRCVCHGCLCE